MGTASSIPQNPPTLYPRKARVTLVLEIEIPDADRDSYIFADPLESADSTAILQTGFLADLFDVLNFEVNLGVEKINNLTQAQITKTLQEGI